MYNKFLVTVFLLFSGVTFANPAIFSAMPLDQFNGQDKELINNFCTQLILSLTANFDLINDQNVSKNTWITFETLTYTTLSSPINEFLKQLSDRGADKCHI
ncbi:Uncharacterised protein [Legionella busanensis]|uniref:Uncharacterized protein n=1 Tax=Legionella busanensis TaxID=190655 RepID=A0A378JPB4_9GAMM|nr:hypothetical protein [Legionella busanensis]STX52123.1 Uncharacterised protein [Legionella busanensis]